MATNDLIWLTGNQATDFRTLLTISEGMQRIHIGCCQPYSYPNYRYEKTTAFFLHTYLLPDFPWSDDRVQQPHR